MINTGLCLLLAEMPKSSHADSSKTCFPFKLSSLQPNITDVQDMQVLFQYGCVFISSIANSVVNVYFKLK